jgi:hypothetical protein
MNLGSKSTVAMCLKSPIDPTQLTAKKHKYQNNHYQ